MTYRKLELTHRAIPIHRSIDMKRSVLERMAAGDSGAINDCISQYGGLVWSLARRLTRTPSDAEDATQEILLHIWLRASSFDLAKGSEAIFITTIARRRLIDRLRKRKSELLIDPSVDVADAAHWADSGISPQISVEAAAAMRALQQLRPEMRRTLELSLVRGWSQSEISTRLRIPLGTVKSNMRRGLMQLREYMQIQTQPFSNVKRGATLSDMASDSSARACSETVSPATGMGAPEYIL